MMGGFLVATLCAATVAGCHRNPQPVMLVAKGATVTRMTGDEIDVRLDLEATNPNFFPVAVPSVTIEARLRQGVALCTATASAPGNIPARKSATFPVDLALVVPTSFTAKLVELARSGDDVDLVPR